MTYLALNPKTKQPRILYLRLRIAIKDNSISQRDLSRPARSRLVGSSVCKSVCTVLYDHSARAISNFHAINVCANLDPDKHTQINAMSDDGAPCSCCY